MVSTTTIVITTGAVLAILALGLGLGLGLNNSSSEDETTTMAPVEPTTTMAPEDSTTTMDPVGPTTTMTPEDPTTTMDPTTTAQPTTTIEPSLPKFTLQDYIDRKFSGKLVNPDWVPSGYSDNAGNLYFDSDDDLNVSVNLFPDMTYQADFVSGQAIMNHNHLDENGEKQKPHHWWPSNNAKYLWVGFDYQKKYRSTSYNSTYELFDVANDQYVSSFFDASNFGGNANDHFCAGGSKSDIQFIKWAPAGNAGVFACGFNLFYFSDPTDISTLKQLTHDGRALNILNGIPDWPYEEEILGMNNMVHFNHDGSKVLFVRLETLTSFQDNGGDQHIYKYSWYGNEQYPRTIEISWPKAGTMPSRNQIFVYDTQMDNLANISELNPYKNINQNDVDIGENYIARVNWQDNHNVVLVYMVRNQDQTTSVFAQSNENNSWTQAAANQFTSPYGWVGSFGPWWPMSSNDVNSFFTIRTKAEVAAESIRNLKAGRDGVTADEIPEGFWTVGRVDRDSFTYLSDHAARYTDTDLVHYDENQDILYFRAAYPEARHRQIHMVANASSRTDGMAPVSVSAQLFEVHPDRCGWIDININGDNVIFNCRGGVGLPASFTKKISAMNDPSYDSFTLIEANEQLQALIDETAYPTKHYGKFPADQNKYGQDYNFHWFQPIDFDPSKKYKLVIEVYAGPEFQKVTDSWAPDFCQTMVSEYDLICASVDGRGSAFQGDRFMMQIYQKLGQFEPVDQTDFAKWMGQKDFIDEDNIAIWGWSYGGYTTTHTIAYNNNGEGTVFKAGVAVAPLASWRYYNVVYSERYMGHTDENQKGYDRAEVWYRAEHPPAGSDSYDGFRNSWYTLISGTADDNVHFMSPAHIEKKLVANDIDFDNFFYADEDHSIRSSPTVNYHVYQNIRRHLLNKRGLDSL